MPPDVQAGTGIRRSMDLSPNQVIWITTRTISGSAWMRISSACFGENTGDELSRRLGTPLILSRTDTAAHQTGAVTRSVNSEPKVCRSAYRRARLQPDSRNIHAADGGALLSRNQEHPGRREAFRRRSRHIRATSLSRGEYSRPSHKAFEPLLGSLSSRALCI